MPRYRKPIALAITGASGVDYALRLLECLIEREARVYLVISQPGQVAIGMESDLKLASRQAEIQHFLTERYRAGSGQLEVFGLEQWAAPVASVSSAPEAMVICPCTTGTLAAIACGFSRSLLERTADVVLKEQKS
jgi:flavin prenyltransferase